MKKILIVEALTSNGMELVKTAKSMGLEVHVATHEDVFETYSSELKKMIDRSVFVDFKNKIDAIEKLVLYGRKFNIGGVISGFEFTSDIVTEVANKLGLKSNDVEKAEYGRNKELMYSAFDSNSIHTGKHRVANSFDELEVVCTEMPLPLIVKPIANSGSCGVFKVSNSDEIMIAWEEIKKFKYEFPHGIELPSGCIVQEYIPGREYSAEVIVQNCLSHVVTLVDKKTSGNGYFAETGHVLPFENLEILKKFKDDVNRIATALGVENGIMHVEFKVYDNKIYIIEAATRMAGDYIPRLLKEARGISLAEMYINVALGQEIRTNELSNRYASIHFLTSLESGIILSINGLENIENDNRVLEINIEKGKGDFIESSHDNLARIGYVIATDDNYASLLEFNDEFTSKIKIEIKG